jgi:hypothetical protein
VETIQDPAPPQYQEHPGLQAAMKPQPVDEDIGYIASAN